MLPPHIPLELYIGRRLKWQTSGTLRLTKSLLDALDIESQ